MNEAQLYAHERFWRAVVNEETLMMGSYRNGIMQTARNMRDDGMSTDAIMKYTGLTLKEIEEL